MFLKFTFLSLFLFWFTEQERKKEGEGCGDFEERSWSTQEADWELGNDE